MVAACSSSSSCSSGCTFFKYPFLNRHISSLPGFFQPSSFPLAYFARYHFFSTTATTTNSTSLSPSLIPCGNTGVFPRRERHSWRLPGGVVHGKNGRAWAPIYRECGERHSLSVAKVCLVGLSNEPALQNRLPDVERLHQLGLHSNCPAGSTHRRIKLDCVHHSRLTLSRFSAGF